MVMATGTGQGRPIKRLEETVDETVVASRMIGQRFGGDDLVWSTDVALYRQQHSLHGV